MKPLLHVAIGAVVALGLASCASSATEPGQAEREEAPVLVTTDIWADVVANVGCSEIGLVEPLIPPGADPHGFQPSIAAAEATLDASVIIANGAGLEESLDALLDQADDAGTTVVYLSDELGVATGEDPHLWLDPTTTASAVAVIERSLVDAGLDAAVVGECGEQYRAQLEDLDDDLAAEVERVAPDRRKLVTNHDALGRFADRYGFEVIGTVLPSTSSLAQANPADLAELSTLIAAENVPALFTEGGHEEADAQALADRLGIEAVGLQTDALGPPGSGFESYVELMTTNTELIVEALGGTEESAQSDAGLLLAAVSNPVSWLIAPFAENQVMRRALVAGLLVVLTTSVVGTWVVLRGMSFLGDALAHGVLPGVAVAFIIGVNTTLGALVAALVMVGILTVLRDRSPMAEDVSIGVLFVGFLALAVVILSSGSDQYVGDLNRFLFGSILAVGDGDLLRQGLAAVLVLAGVVVFHRSLLCLTFDRQLAQLLGLRPRLAHAVLLVLIMVAIVSSFEAVGNLLVFAFLVAPPATAALLVKRVPVIMAVAVALGTVAVVVGLLVAYHYRSAAEATMALVAVSLFLVVVALPGGRGARRRPAAAI